MISSSSLFSTLTGGHTVGGFILGLLALCGGICGTFFVMRYLLWLVFVNRKKRLFEFRNGAYFYLKELINGQWSNRPRTVFVIGEFEGRHKERRTVFKIMEGWGYDPEAIYLLLKPNIPQTQNLPAPSMSFHFVLKRYLKPTENTYIKGGWLIYKPKLSYCQSAGEFYMDKQNLLQALEELTRAAEIIEAKPLVEDSPKLGKKGDLG